MLTPEQRREYEIYRLADLIAEQTGRDGPDRPLHEEDLLRAAETAVDAAARGEITSETLMVILGDAWQLPGEPYHWTYLAVEPEDRLKGCVHHVHGSTHAMRQASAVVDHRTGCLGERG